MSQYSLEHFGAYQKSKELFDLVVTDMAELRHDPGCHRLIAQQIASADSICANIEEGYGRLSRAEYVRFLDFSRGSARETRGRYERMKHWLKEEIVAQRVSFADQIIGILTKSIQTMQREPTRVNTTRVREAPHPEDNEWMPPTFDTQPSTHDPRHS